MNTPITAEMSQRLSVANAAGFAAQLRGDLGISKEATTTHYGRATAFAKAAHVRRSAVRETILKHVAK